MRVSERVVMVVVSLVLGSAVAATSASAQVCGDADGNGSVTVTDGVQVLRDAADLSSTCSAQANNCDVDGNGTVTLSDGVNVLRKAAGLTITEACPGGGAAGDLQEVTDQIIPFLTVGLQQVPNVTPGLAAPAGGTEDCEDGGTRSTSSSLTEIRVTFTDCRVSEPGLGAFELDGFIEVDLGIPTSTVTFELNITDLDADRFIDFDGTIVGGPRGGGGFIVDSGVISVRAVEGGPEIIRLTIHEDFEVDGDGHIVRGSAEAEDTSDSFDLETAEFEVEDGSSTATIHVVRDDGSEDDFLVNLETGVVTPAG